MSNSSTAAVAAPVQAAPLAGAGDGSGTPENEGGQDNFSMSIVPDGSATAKQSTAKKPGAGQPAQAGEKTIFEGGDPGNAEGAVAEGEQPQGGKPSKSDQNAANKEQRNSQAGWQQITELLTKTNERLDKLEQGKQQAPEPKAGEGEPQGQGAQDNEAMSQLVATLAATNARLERMEFESNPENADLRTAELSKEWKNVNSDPKFKDFSMDERANYVRGKSGKSDAGAIHEQLSRAEGSMPRGSGGGAPQGGGNPNVTEEDVAVGAAFGFTRQDLESELS